MKAVIILLAVLYIVFADEQHDHCLHACREKIKTHIQADNHLAPYKPEELATAEGRAKMRAAMKHFIAGTGTLPQFLTNVDTLAKVCMAATEAELCVNACPDSQAKEGAKKLANFLKSSCDADFKASVLCLAEVNKSPSPICEGKCNPFATPMSQYIAQRDAAPNEFLYDPPDVLEAGCKFLNCRLNCRKTDIINKCQDKGFETAKKLISGVTNLAMIAYKRMGGDLANWPDSCKSEKVIEAHEY